MLKALLSATIARAAGSALAQTGTLDQSSPRTNASYDLNTSSLIWQQQIRCGRGGILEGIRLSFLGPLGATMTLQIRMGAAPSSHPVLARHEIVKATAGLEEAFVDLRSDAILLASNDLFVMEAFGNDTGLNLVGNYVAPPAKPFYPEPLYLNGSIFPPGWRHGFDTYMVSGPAPCYANCDGSTGTPLLSAEDFVCFSQRFEASDPYADCNHDSALNVNDFVCFQTAFAAGCHRDLDGF